LYFHRKKAGRSNEAILQEIIGLKSKSVVEIENYVIKNLGSKSLETDNDISRFMTPDELTIFAQNPLVHIGNHSHKHEILTNLTLEEVQKELEISQQILEKLLGYKTNLISYPNGSFDENIISVSVELGMNIGITTIMEKNYFPLDNRVNGQLLLHRFNPVVHNGNMHLSKFRSSFQLKTQLKKWLN